jgi:hypothetical protein
MDKVAISKNGTHVRLPDERWQHILNAHPELSESRTSVLEVVSNPEAIYEGSNRQLLSV